MEKMTCSQTFSQHTARTPPRRLSTADAAVVVGGTPLDRAALCAMGGVHFAVEQLKKASAAVTRRAWLAVVMDAVCGGPADPADDADAAEVCLVTRALFLYFFCMIMCYYWFQSGILLCIFAFQFKRPLPTVNFFPLLQWMSPVHPCM